MSNLRRVALTFGSRLSIKDVVATVGQALDLTFEARESLYLGGDYYRSVSTDYKVVVQHNNDLGEPAEPAHPELPTLVRVDGTADWTQDVVPIMQSLGLIMIDRNYPTAGRMGERNVGDQRVPARACPGTQE